VGIADMLGEEKGASSGQGSLPGGVDDLKDKSE